MIAKTDIDNQLVSICIPTYNSAKFLRESLESIVNQTYQNIEILVIDNASSDNSKEIIEEYKEKYKIGSYINEYNIGAEANFDRCVRTARGDYIAIKITGSYSFIRAN